MNIKEGIEKIENDAYEHIKYKNNFNSKTKRIRKINNFFSLMNENNNSNEFIVNNVVKKMMKVIIKIK